MTLEIVPLTSAIGAEIRGIDLSKDLSEKTLSAIKRAWVRHAVLVFRQQTLTPHDQVRVTRYFGTPKTHWLKDSLLPEQPEVMRVSNILENGEHIGVYNAGRFWHSDLSYVDAPDRAGILYALEIPVSNGVALGDTLYTSTSAAYDALDTETKLAIEGLLAVFSVAKRNANLQAAKDSKTEPDKAQQNDQQAIHPVVRVHPESGRKCIYVSEGHTANILGLDPSASHELIERLCAHVRQTQFIYRHHWQPGDVVMWDNIPTQHVATFDYAWPQRRLLHRTTIEAGELLPDRHRGVPDENQSDAASAG